MGHLISNVSFLGGNTRDANLKMCYYSNHYKCVPPTPPPPDDRSDRLEKSSRAGENAQETTGLSRHLISKWYSRLKLSFTFKYSYLKMAPDSVKEEIKHLKRATVLCLCYARQNWNISILVGLVEGCRTIQVVCRSHTCVFQACVFRIVCVRHSHPEWKSVWACNGASVGQ